VYRSVDFAGFKGHIVGHLTPIKYNREINWHRWADVYTWYC